MIDVMVLFGADRENAEKQMEQVYLLEKQIATVPPQYDLVTHSTVVSYFSFQSSFLGFQRKYRTSTFIDNSSTFKFYRGEFNFKSSPPPLHPGALQMFACSTAGEYK